MPTRSLALAVASALIACAGTHGGSQTPRQRAPSEVPELNQRQLGEFVRARMGFFTACYENALERDHTLRGRVELRFTVLEDGSVADVTSSEPPAMSHVGGCMVGAVESWHTPFRPPEPITVEYPFVFSSVE